VTILSDAFMFPPRVRMGVSPIGGKTFQFTPSTKQPPCRDSMQIAPRLAPRPDPLGIKRSSPSQEAVRAKNEHSDAENSGCGGRVRPGKLMQSAGQSLRCRCRFAMRPAWFDAD